LDGQSLVNLLETKPNNWKRHVDMMITEALRKKAATLMFA
jgi:hypothetical protein